MRRFDLVLFDLDGTLIDTGREIADAVNDTLGSLGLPAVTLERVCGWIGHGTRELLVQSMAFATGSAPDSVRAAPSLGETVAGFEQHYQQRCGTRSQLYPQVREVLLALRAHAIFLAVVTNKPACHTHKLLEAHQIATLFDWVISGDSLPTRKPDPAGVMACLERFQVTPSRALFVGDSSIDVATARSAGVSVWVVPYGYNMGHPITAAGADRVIQDFAALRAIMPAAP